MSQIGRFLVNFLGRSSLSFCERVVSKQKIFGETVGESRNINPAGKWFSLFFADVVTSDQVNEVACQAYLPWI